MAVFTLKIMETFQHMKAHLLYFEQFWIKMAKKTFCLICILYTFTLIVETEISHFDEI